MPGQWESCLDGLPGNSLLNTISLFCWYHSYQYLKLNLTRHHDCKFVILVLKGGKLLLSLSCMFIFWYLGNQILERTGFGEGNWKN